jgi:hypothetical protein
MAGSTGWGDSSRTYEGRPFVLRYLHAGCRVTRNHVVTGENLAISEGPVYRRRFAVSNSLGGKSIFTTHQLQPGPR